MISRPSRLRRAARLVTKILGALGALLVLAVLFFCWRTASSLIRPARETQLHALSLPHEDVRFETDDHVAIAGWYVPPAAPRAPAIVLLHGIGANRNEFNIDCTRDAVEYDWRCPESSPPQAAHPTFIDALHARGYAVLAIDLRAHGASGGDLCTYGRDEVADVAAAVRWLNGRDDVDSSRLGIYGESLGGIVAVRAAARIPALRAVGMESPFADLGTGLADTFSRATGLPPSVAWPVIAIARLRGDDVAQIRPVLDVPLLGDRPLLVIADMKDAFATPADGRRMFRASLSPRSVLWEVPDTAHVQARGFHPDEHDDKVCDFFDAAFSASARMAPVRSSNPSPSMGGR